MDICSYEILNVLPKNSRKQTHNLNRSAIILCVVYLVFKDDILGEVAIGNNDRFCEVSKKRKGNFHQEDGH